MAILNIGGLIANIYVTHVSSNRPQFSGLCVYNIRFICLCPSVLILAACRVLQREGHLPSSQSGASLGAAAIYPVSLCVFTTANTLSAAFCLHSVFACFCKEISIFSHFEWCFYCTRLRRVGDSNFKKFCENKCLFSALVLLIFMCLVSVLS